MDFIIIFYDYYNYKIYINFSQKLINLIKKNQKWTSNHRSYC